MPTQILVPLLFLCSGATALIYEVIWSKYLGQMLGSTINAQTVVLAVFMGGLAVGNNLFGRKAAATRDPLALYATLELLIGLYGFFFPTLFDAADSLFIRMGQGMVEDPARMLLIKTGVSVGLLAVPTILMGGTLPLLANWLQRNSADYARASARFYSLNSLGAVFGAAAAGFVIVRDLGMVAGLQATGLLNALIWIVALSLARMGSPQRSRPTQEVPKTSPSGNSTTSTVAGHRSSNLRLVGMLVAVTGGVSMGLEVLASRSLSLIFGASLHAFAVVLMGFILGIAAGAAVIASPRIRRWPPAATVTVLLASASVLLSCYLFFIDDWAEVYRHLRSGIARNAMGYRYHLALNTLISVLALGLPAGLLGATVPLFIRHEDGEGEDIATRIGTLLTWNTLGAVCGVLITGFGLMPHLGIRTSFAVLAALLGATAAASALRARNKIGIGCGATALAAAVFTLFTGTDDWRYVFSSGLFRNRETQVIGRVVEMRKQQVEILFYKDAPDATVSVERPRKSGPEQRILRVNGKPDASSRSDLSTQYLLAHLPMLAKPDSKDVFVLGFGSGITAGAVATHPIRSLTIAENCRPVLQAGKWFEPWNRGVLTNRLARVIEEDARTVLKLDPKHYDVIISEPSNPWMAGVGSVFSTEFYQLAASRLNEGGVMAQWFHIYEINDGIVALVLRTFGSVFPFFEIWDTYEGDIVLIGSQKPWQSSLANFNKVYEREAPRNDLIDIGLTTPETVLGRQMATSRIAWAIAGPGAVQSDSFPILEYEAPKAFYIGGKSDWFEKFDERTWLRDLANLQKRTVLSELSDDRLYPLFAEYGSVSPHVTRYVLMRRRNQDTQPAYQSFINANPLPSIFRGDVSWTQPLAIDPRSNPADQALAEGELLLMTQPNQWRTAVQKILAGLQSTEEVKKRTTTATPPTHFAGLAAIRCLGQGDVPAARTLVDLGLSYDSSHIALNFLSRLCSQESLFRVRQ